MPVTIKYKLGDVAKDLGVQNKEVIELLDRKSTRLNSSH